MLGFSPGHLHFEISSFCNAACQLCPRYVKGDDGYWLNPLLTQQHIDPHIVNRLLNHPLNSQVKVVLFCGDYGDPMFHPEILDLVEMVRRTDRIEQFHMHSNAGLASTQTWQDLAGMMRRDRFVMFFSIDGLEDTNHIYRRNVRWERIMENANAFIAAGGQAIWKMIVFEHNKHQIDEARRLAKQMGFRDFWLQENDGGYPVDPDLPLVKRRHTPQPKPTRHALLMANEQQRRDVHTITCEHRLDRSLYVSASGHAWPCCWLADGRDHPDAVLRGLTDLFLEAPYGQGWNDLHAHDLDEMYTSAMWSDLQRDIDDRTGIYRCSHVCGRTREQVRAISLGLDASESMQAGK